MLFWSYLELLFVWYINVDDCSNDSLLWFWRATTLGCKMCNNIINEDINVLVMKMLFDNAATLQFFLLRRPSPRSQPIHNIIVDVFGLCNRFCDTKISNIDVFLLLLAFQYGLCFIISLRIVLGSQMR